MADEQPNVTPSGAQPGPKPAEGGKVQPKKETVRITLPPKPTAAPTIKIPRPSAGAKPAPAAKPAAAQAAAPAAAKPAAAKAPASAAAPAAAAAPAKPQRRAPARAAAPAAPALSPLDNGLAIAAAVVAVVAFVRLFLLR